MIIVTGASGLLGANLVLHARASRRQVAGLYHSHPIHIPGVPMAGANLTDHAAAAATFRNLSPSAIIHCAAATNVDWCEDHSQEAEQINVVASSLIAELAAELGAQLIYVSTDSVFDGLRGNYSEVDEPHAISVYAQTKLDGERETQRQKPDAIIARVNIYGWNAQPKQSLAEWVLGRLRSGQQVSGFTDVIFCPVLVNDVAEILLSMLDAGLTGVYHVVASDRLSKYEFAKAVAREFGLDSNAVIPATVSDAQLRAPRPRNLSLSTAKIESALGKEMPDVASGLRRFKSLHDEGYADRMRSLVPRGSA